MIHIQYYMTTKENHFYYFQFKLLNVSNMINIVKKNLIPILYLSTNSQVLRTKHFTNFLAKYTIPL